MRNKISLEVVTSCEGCGGSCCYAMGLLPIGAYVGHAAFDDVSKIPPWLAAELRAELAKVLSALPVKGETPCMWLDQVTGKCKNYAYRPSICRSSSTATSS